MYELDIKKIRERPYNFCWLKLSGRKGLPSSFIREFRMYIHWYILSQNTGLDESIIREFQDKVDWEWIFLRQELSESFQREFDHKNPYLAIRKNCGIYGRTITISKNNPDVIRIGCSEYTEEEALKRIIKEYGNLHEGKWYRRAVKECFEEADSKLDGSWFSTRMVVQDTLKTSFTRLIKKVLRR